MTIKKLPNNLIEFREKLREYENKYKAGPQSGEGHDVNFDMNIRKGLWVIQDKMEKIMNVRDARCCEHCGCSYAHNYDDNQCNCVILHKVMNLGQTCDEFQ